MYLVKWLKNKKTNNTKPDKYRSKWKSHTLPMGIWYNHFGKPSDNIYETEPVNSMTKHFHYRVYI